MKVLFLSHYFPPEVNAPATRTYEHCRRWVERGHEVTVVSCVPHHPMGQAFPGYENRWWYEETKDGIRAIKLKTYITANEGFVKRTWNYVFYMIMAIVMCGRFGRADVVLSTSPQFFNGLAGYFVSRIKRCPWVLEIRDLWPESIVAVGAISNKFIVRVLESIERFAYRNADAVVPVTHAFATHIEKCGADPNKIRVIRNGVNLSLFGEATADEATLTEWELENKFVLAYVGTHGMAHGLETVLEAANRLKEHTDIAFLLVGDGAVRSKLLATKERLQLNNVVMKGQQPKEMMPAIWRLTDVSLVVLRRLDLFRTVIPSKIFESMAMSKPMILGVEGEVADIVEEAQTGICITPESVDELVDAVLRLKNDTQHYEQLAKNGRPFVVEHFNRINLADEYLELLEST